jgi:hypothetical protein
MVTDASFTIERSCEDAENGALMASVLEWRPFVGRAAAKAVAS